MCGMCLKTPMNRVPLNTVPLDRNSNAKLNQHKTSVTFLIYFKNFSGVNDVGIIRPNRKIVKLANTAAAICSIKDSCVFTKNACSPVIKTKYKLINTTPNLKNRLCAYLCSGFSSHLKMQRLPMLKVRKMFTYGCRPRW